MATPVFQIEIMDCGLLKSVNRISATPYPFKDAACERAIWMAEPFPEATKTQDRSFSVSFYDPIKQKVSIVLSRSKISIPSTPARPPIVMDAIKTMIANQQWSELQSSLDHSDSSSSMEVALVNNLWKSIIYAVNMRKITPLTLVAKKISSLYSNCPTDDVLGVVTELNSKQAQSGEFFVILKNNEQASQKLSRCLLLVIESLSRQR